MTFTTFGQLSRLAVFAFCLIVVSLLQHRTPSQAQPKPDRSAPGAIGATAESVGWRLTRSSVPGGGTTASILRTADPGSSDVDVAGLMFRCAENGTDALFIVLSPFGPAAKPTIALDLGGLRFETEASVLPSGAGLLVPRDMLSLFAAPEKMMADLSFVISEGGRRFSGRIAKLYAAPALARLQTECSQPR
jgi:hypothetical protein